MKVNTLSHLGLEIEGVFFHTCNEMSQFFQNNFLHTQNV